MDVVRERMRSWCLPWCLGIRSWFLGILCWVVGPAGGDAARYPGWRPARMRRTGARAGVAGAALASTLLIAFPAMALAQQGGSSFDPNTLVKQIIGVAVLVIVLVVIGKGVFALSKGAIATLATVIVVGSILYVIGSDPENTMDAIGSWFTDAAGATGGGN